MHAPLLTIVFALLLAAVFAEEEYFTYINSPVNGTVEKVNFGEKQPFLEGDVLIEVSYVPKKPPPTPQTPLPIDFGSTYEEEDKENGGGQEEYPEGASVEVNYRDSEVLTHPSDAFDDNISVDAKRLAMNGGAVKSRTDGKDLERKIWTPKATDRGLVIKELVRVGDSVVPGQRLLRVYYAALNPKL